MIRLDRRLARAAPASICVFCVFCGSSPGKRPVYTSAAIALAQHLVSRQITIVYGGGNLGLMGILADTALSAGGEVIGVIPRALVDKERAHRGLSRAPPCH